MIPVTLCPQCGPSTSVIVVLFRTIFMNLTLLWPSTRVTLQSDSNPALVKALQLHPTKFHDWSAKQLLSFVREQRSAVGELRLGVPKKIAKMYIAKINGEIEGVYAKLK